MGKNGFSVEENENGKCGIAFSYIAIGKRKGYENPQLPEEVMAADYTAKLSAGLHNDHDTESNGGGLYYENEKLTVGVHPSTRQPAGKRYEPGNLPGKNTGEWKEIRNINATGNKVMH